MGPKHKFPSAQEIPWTDLTLFPRFCFADWTQLTALRPYWKSLRWLAVGYDINCQYRIKFHERIKELQSRYGHLKSIPTDDFVFELLSPVGKFHLSAHTLTCRFKFSYYYLRGVGMTDGEALERIWSILNSLAARTKEMTPGHRHDILNDFLGDMNVRKLHSIGQSTAYTPKQVTDSSSSPHVSRQIRQGDEAAG